MSRHFDVFWLHCVLIFGATGLVAGQTGSIAVDSPAVTADKQAAIRSTGKPQRERSVVPLSGTADLPRWVRPGEGLSYTLRSVGQFITPAGGTPHNIDVTTRARPVMLRSIRPDSLKVQTAVLPNGERVYRVTGTARKESGVYMDTWMAFNSPRDAATLPATPELFVQTVFIMVDPVTSTGGDSPPPLPPSLDWQPVPPNMLTLARAVHPTPRESAAERLLPKLLARLSAAQRLEIARGKEMAIPVASLPSALQKEATDYIAVSCRGIGGRSPVIMRDPREPVPYDGCDLVILPGHEHVLGVDDRPQANGTRSHF